MQSTNPDIMTERYSVFFQHLSEKFLETATPCAHWGSIFIGGHQHEITDQEVMIDNEPWLDGHMLVESIDWQLSNEYEWVRHFFIALPDDSSLAYRAMELSGAVESREHIVLTKEEIIRFSDIFLEEPEANDAQLVKSLIKRGMKQELAERFIAFLPIAFARVVIHKIGQVQFSNQYQVQETGLEYCLDDEPTFTLALTIATGSMQTGLVGRAKFQAIASRSCEMVSVNNALNAGGDINGGCFAAVVLFGYETLK